MKHDGYRLIARKDAGRVRLWSRHGTDFTDKMPKIVEAVRNLPVNNALIDGEAVVLRLEDIAILSRCAPRPAASKPHSSPSTFSASNATISASKLSRTGERRSSNWSQELTASSSESPTGRRRDRVRLRLQAGSRRDRVEARLKPLSQRGEPQLVEVPEPEV